MRQEKQQPKQQLGYIHRIGNKWLGFDTLIPQNYTALTQIDQVVKDSVIFRIRNPSLIKFGDQIQRETFKKLLVAIANQVYIKQSKVGGCIIHSCLDGRGNDQQGGFDKLHIHVTVFRSQQDPSQIKEFFEVNFVGIELERDPRSIQSEQINENQVFYEILSVKKGIVDLVKYNDDQSFTISSITQGYIEKNPGGQYQLRYWQNLNSIKVLTLTQGLDDQSPTINQVFQPFNQYLDQWQRQWSSFFVNKINMVDVRNLLLQNNSNPSNPNQPTPNHPITKKTKSNPNNIVPQFKHMDSNLIDQILDQIQFTKQPPDSKIYGIKSQLRQLINSYFEKLNAFIDRFNTIAIGYYDFIQTNDTSLYKQLSQMTDNSPNRQHIFWICGDSGTGKSQLIKTLSELSTGKKPESYIIFPIHSSESLVHYKDAQINKMGVDLGLINNPTPSQIVNLANQRLVITVLEEGGTNSRVFQNEIELVKSLYESIETQLTVEVKQNQITYLKSQLLIVTTNQTQEQIEQGFRDIDQYGPMSQRSFFLEASQYIKLINQYMSSNNMYITGDFNYYIKFINLTLTIFDTSTSKILDEVTTSKLFPSHQSGVVWLCKALSDNLLQDLPILNQIRQDNQSLKYIKDGDGDEGQTITIGQIQQMQYSRIQDLIKNISSLLNPTPDPNLKVLAIKGLSDLPHRTELLYSSFNKGLRDTNKILLDELNTNNNPELQNLVEELKLYYNPILPFTNIVKSNGCLLCHWFGLFLSVVLVTHDRFGDLISKIEKQVQETLTQVCQLVYGTNYVNQQLQTNIDQLLIEQVFYKLEVHKCPRGGYTKPLPHLTNCDQKLMKLVREFTNQETSDKFKHNVKSYLIERYLNSID